MSLYEIAQNSQKDDSINRHVTLDKMEQVVILLAVTHWPRQLHTTARLLLVCDYSKLVDSPNKGHLQSSGQHDIHGLNSKQRTPLTKRMFYRMMLPLMVLCKIHIHEVDLMVEFELNMATYVTKKVNF